MINKRGVAVWISWVLVVAFAALIGSLVFKWMIVYVKEQTVQIEERVYDESLCEDLSLVVKDLCQKDQKLKFKLLNNGFLTVDRLIFRMFDVENNPFVVEQAIELSPGRTENFEVIKQGHINNLEILPVTIENNREIVCQQSTASFNEIKVCAYE